jgi:formylglycine-generating enzyme required for sulfatase activity
MGSPLKRKLPRGLSSVATPIPARARNALPLDELVWIAGGAFRLGSNRHYPGEAPAHEVDVGGFWIDRATITNAEFSRFVRETAHVTRAERPANTADYPARGGAS